MTVTEQAEDAGLAPSASLYRRAQAPAMSQLSFEDAIRGGGESGKITAQGVRRPAF